MRNLPAVPAAGTQGHSGLSCSWRLKTQSGLSGAILTRKLTRGAMNMTGKVAYTPSDWAKNGDPYDCTGFIGPLYPNDDINDPPEWPTYSSTTPAYILW